MSGRDLAPPGGIAIVGLACRFPGADSADRFWANLRAGTESISHFSVGDLLAAGIDRKTLEDPHYVRAKGVLDEADRFDAGFFGFSPREAALMDPQQRVFLECAWTAIEDAGIEPRHDPGAIGVFAGSILSIYLLQNLWPNRALIEAAGNFQMAVGNDPTFLATRTSYLLDLTGPSVSIGTACSTALVAVHLACQSLLARESDVALAGGVSIHLPLVGGYRHEDGGILSPDGHCRPFDAAARGTVSSDGVGIVVLKRLEDALAQGDDIRAVIRGSAINNDGHAKVGYTAPSIPSQARLITEALAVAGVPPETVALVEAHAAGTPLGDPIEVAALREAFGRGGAGAQSCAIGSVKSNIGHVDAAAGIAGLIKTVLALRHREIPPTLHYRAASPALDLRNTPFYVNAALRPLSDRPFPARGCVSAFGIGGTNAHVVLEEAARPGRVPGTRPCELLLLSARSAAALDAATLRLADHLESAPDQDLADVGHTLRLGRRSFEHRRFVLCRNSAQAVAALRGQDPEPRAGGVVPAEAPAVTFMFSGLGDHYPGMGWALYCTEPVFRDTVESCAEKLQGHLGVDIRDHLYPGEDWARPVLQPEPGRDETGVPKLDLRAMLGRKPAAEDRPSLAQPAIFVTEIALARLLQSWGIQAQAMIGYSIGEISAACSAGILTLPDALDLVAARARLIETQVAPGAMLAVPLEDAELRGLLPPDVVIAAVNGAALSVASGEARGIAELESRLGAQGASCRRLRSTHAYHSDMMAGIVDPLIAVLNRITLHAPQIPILSCVTGTWLTAADATDPLYWARHLCRKVRFRDGLAALFADRTRLLLEIGPGQSLASHALAERNRDPARRNPVIPTMRWSYGREADHAVLLRAVGLLWLAGAELDMTRCLAAEGRRRVPLPTYPFERQRYWIDPPRPGHGAAAAAQTKMPRIEDWFYLPHWKPSVRPPALPVSGGDVLVFADRFGVGTDLGAALRRRGARVATVTAGQGFAAEGDEFTLDPARSDHYGRLIDALRAGGRLPRTILHLWSLTPATPGAPSRARFEALQETGFFALTRLLRALGGAGSCGALRIEIVATEMFDPEGAAATCPEKATLLAPVLVAPQEYPGLVCRCIDIAIAPDDPARRANLLAEILAEIDSAPSPSIVACRQGRRFIRAYEPVRLASPAPDRLPFRRRGVYLLTGGLGGIGLVLARHLAETVEARLVLIGRTGLPNRDDWDLWRAGHDETDRTSRRIRQIRDLEALGAEVLVLSADVADPTAMAAALGAAEARFGALHGVIHGAGAIGIETFAEIASATTADAERQFQAKAHGLLVLDALLGDRRLDFRLLMSSLSAILGGLGFAAYSAANLFMDAFARRKNADGRPLWTSVDWESWNLDDVRPVRAGLGSSVNAFAMTPGEGCEACCRILAETSLGQVIVSSGALQGRLDQWIDRRGTAKAEPAPLVPFRRPELDADYVAPRGELEQALAEIWRDLFNVEPIGVDDNFFALGGHSLLATQLNARLSAKLGVELSLATLLQAPTIAELAVAVVATEAKGVDPDLLDSMLAEIGTLTDAEARRLLEDEPLQRIAAGDDV